MYRFKFGQLAVVSASGLIWLIWIVLTNIFRDSFSANDKLGSNFLILFAWSVIVYFALWLPIMSPDMNLVSKRVNDTNRLKIVEIRRTMFAWIQLTFVFLACGTAISLFFTRWRLGVGVTVSIYLISLGASLLFYILDFKRFATKQSAVSKTDNEIFNDTINLLNLESPEEPSENKEENNLG